MILAKAKANLARIVNYDRKHTFTIVIQATGLKVIKLFFLSSLTKMPDRLFGFVYEKAFRRFVNVIKNFFFTDEEAE
jgi:hypothetical protein